MAIGTRGDAVNLIGRWIILTLAVWLSDVLIGGVSIADGVWNHLWVAALFGLANAVVGNIIRVVAFPALILTLGIFSIVVNAWMLMWVGSLSDALDVGGFWPAFGAGVIISLVSAILGRRMSNRD
ncbi:MAG: phage holin family protein [Ilumatobacteraceae bacterium]